MLKTITKSTQTDNMVPILLGSLIVCLSNIVLVMSNPVFAAAVELSAQ